MEIDVTEQSAIDGCKENTRQAPLTEEQLRAVHVNGLAPLAQPIQIADYDSAWPTLFAREPRASVPRSASGSCGSNMSARLPCPASPPNR